MAKKNIIRVFEGFAGYGGASFGLKRLKEKMPHLDYKIVGYSEFDKFASSLFDANIKDKNGNLMAIILASDESGNVDLMLFAREYERLHNEFEAGKCCYVQGKVQIRTGNCIIVDDAKVME